MPRNAAQMADAASSHPLPVDLFHSETRPSHRNKRAHVPSDKNLGYETSVGRSSCRKAKPFVDAFNQLVASHRPEGRLFGLGTAATPLHFPFLLTVRLL